MTDARDRDDALKAKIQRPASEERDLPEGEEAAPPGVRTMAIVRWVLVAVMAVAAAGSILYYFGKLPRAGAPASAARYYCPMHPSIVQDQPGDCPICSMTLVPVGSSQGNGKHAASIATKHAHVAGPSSSAIYACPMHPDQTSADPKARCPICGMKLEPKKIDQKTAPRAPATSGSAAHSAHSVPGLAAVDLPAGRIQLIGMRTARVTRETLVPEMRTVGFVATSERGLTTITTRFSGWIEQLLVNQTGARVARGQVLATIYSRELLTAQQEFLSARRWAGTAGKASAEVRQLSSTIDTDSRRRLELLGISRQEIDDIARIGQPLRALKIRSPASGYVTQKNAFAGLYVQPGTQLFEVADLSTIWVLADIYEHEVGRVRVGQEAQLELPAYPGQSFPGKVRFISPTLDPSTRTLRLRIELRNPDLKLKPGMYGTVKVELEPATGLVVPREGIVDTGELQYAFVALAGGRFESRRVKLGTRSDTKVQVQSGLEEGETIVTTGNFLIDSESRLRSSIEGLSAAEGDKPGGGAPSGHAGHGQ